MGAIYIYVFPKCKQNAYVAISNVYIALSSRAGDVQGVDKFLLRAFIINYSRAFLLTAIGLYMFLLLVSA